MLFTILRPIVTIWLWLFYPYKIYGKENITQDGNVIVICNHLGKVDVPMVGYLFRGKTYYLAKKEWFDKGWRKWLFSQLGGIPIDRDKPDLQSMKMVIGLLKSGKRLCIFPEGTRNRENTEIQKLHGGAGVFAFKTGAKILPLNILHPARMWRKNSIYIGKAFDFSEFAGQKLDAELNEKLTQKMYDELCKAKAEHQVIFDAKNKKKVK